MRLLLVTQAILGLLLIVSILMQNRGSGLGAAFGSDFGGYHTKRGLEKFLFRASITLGALFIIVALASVYFSAH